MPKIEIKPPTDSKNVTEYLDRFGHLPSMEALKWMTPKQLEKIAGEALKENKPIKEWEERPNIKLGSVLDEMYDTPVSDIVNKIKTDNNIDDDY